LLFSFFLGSCTLDVGLSMEKAALGMIRVHGLLEASHLAPQEINGFITLFQAILITLEAVLASCGYLNLRLAVRATLASSIQVVESDPEMKTDLLLLS
jgi:hypothetical protein